MLSSRRMVAALINTSIESLELSSQRPSAAALTQCTSILQKICFEFNCAYQFAKGYCLPTHGNDGTEICIQPWHDCSIFSGSIPMSRNVYKTCRDIKTSVRVTVNSKVMAIFNLMTLLYKKRQIPQNQKKITTKPVAILLFTMKKKKASILFCQVINEHCFINRNSMSCFILSKHSFS